MSLQCTQVCTRGLRKDTKKKRTAINIQTDVQYAFQPVHKKPVQGTIKNIKASITGIRISLSRAPHFILKAIIEFANPCIMPRRKKSDKAKKTFDKYGKNSSKGLRIAAEKRSRSRSRQTNLFLWAPVFLHPKQTEAKHDL